MDGLVQNFQWLLGCFQATFGWVMLEGGVCVGIVGGRVRLFGIHFSQSKNARLFN